MATIISTSFTGNAAGNLGGALFCTQSEVVLDGCTFSGNTAGADGGAIFVNGGVVRATGCTFAHNQARRGGGLFLNGGDLALDRSILAFSDGGEAAGSSGGEVVVACCDVFGNGGGDWVGPLAGMAGSDGNFGDDPRFCGEANPGAPYALDATSPCAAANNPACGQIGAWPVGCATTVAVEPGVMPTAAIVAASPNPFNPSTRIRFVLAEAGPAQLAIHDVAGHRLRSLAGGTMDAGVHAVEWDGRDDAGSPVAAGVYVCRLTAGTVCDAIKLSLLK